MANIPVNLFEWDENFTGQLHELTCKDHSELRWATKHLNERSLHFLGDENGNRAEECACDISFLEVIVAEKR